MNEKAKKSVKKRRPRVIKEIREEGVGPWFTGMQGERRRVGRAPSLDEIDSRPMKRPRSRGIE